MAEAGQGTAAGRAAGRFRRGSRDRWMITGQQAGEGRGAGWVHPLR